MMEYDERKATWGGGGVQPIKAGLMFLAKKKQVIQFIIRCLGDLLGIKYCPVI